jgi:hypothetical protein
MLMTGRILMSSVAASRCRVRGARSTTVSTASRALGMRPCGRLDGGRVHGATVWSVTDGRRPQVFTINGWPPEGGTVSPFEAARGLSWGSYLVTSPLLHGLGCGCRSRSEWLARLPGRPYMPFLGARGVAGAGAKGAHRSLPTGLPGPDREGSKAR